MWFLRKKTTTPEQKQYNRHQTTKITQPATITPLQLVDMEIVASGVAGVDDTDESSRSGILRLENLEARLPLGDKSPLLIDAHQINTKPQHKLQI